MSAPVPTKNAEGTRLKEGPKKTLGGQADGRLGTGRERGENSEEGGKEMTKVRVTRESSCFGLSPEASCGVCEKSPWSNPAAERWEEGWI